MRMCVSAVRARRYSRGCDAAVPTGRKGLAARCGALVGRAGGLMAACSVPWGRGAPLGKLLASCQVRLFLTAGIALMQLWVMLSVFGTFPT